MKSVMALVLAGSGVAVAQDAVQWRVEDGGNGHWYQAVFIGEGTTSEKFAYVQSRGARLASLTSQNEFQFAAFTVCDSSSLWVADENGCLCGGPAIGGFRESDGSFRWLDGSIWDYSPWHGGNPDGDTSEAQLIRLWDYFGNRRFVDHRLLGETGSEIQSVLLEWSADCDGDGIVDYGQILNGSLIDSNGDGVPDNCAEGACCIGSACINTEVSSCEMAGGTFEGFDVVCSSQVCPLSCEGDTTGNGVVDFADLISVLNSWGPCSDG